MKDLVVLKWPKSPHEFRFARLGTGIVATLVIRKRLTKTILVPLPPHLSLKDILDAWSARGDWREIYRKDFDKNCCDAVRVIDLRGCKIVWVLRHYDDVPADVCYAVCGEVSDADLVAANFDLEPAPTVAPAEPAAAPAELAESDVQTPGTA
jgi:hypothetical protein